MKILVILVFSLILSNTVNISLDSNLEFKNQKIINRDVNDSEIIFPLQNFLIELKENQNISLDA